MRIIGKIVRYTFRSYDLNDLCKCKSAVLLSADYVFPRIADAMHVIAD